MNILWWLARKLSQRRVGRATTEYLRELERAPVRRSLSAARNLLAELRSAPGTKVHVGGTSWGEEVPVPLVDMIKACGLTTGGMGSGKTMFALLPLEAIIRRLPGVEDVAFGVFDPKGELFDRALYLLACRLDELRGREQQELLDRIVIIDFANREAISSYNILARWKYAEPDYFVTSRLETLRELLPSGEKLSLRGASVLKHVLMLLSEFGLPLTHLDRVLGSEEFRGALLGRSKNDMLKLYFDRHFLMEGKQTIAALRARMDSLFASEGVRLALSGSMAPDFLRLQNEGKIVLINCAGPTITRGVRLLLQGLVLSDIRQSIFARPNNPPVTYLWVADEAQNFFLTRQQQENMADVLTMARSFGSFFYFLCQNLTTAVPDSRILEMLYTNIRWSLTLRSTPHDAAFLRAALPVTGRVRRPGLNPFEEAGFYKPEEERNLLLNGVANLPDREGYLWLKTRSAQALRIRTPQIDLPEGEIFRNVVGMLRDEPALGGRASRAEYERLMRERDRQWIAPDCGRAELKGELKAGYRRKQAVDGDADARS
jgi:hypothetical protein